MKKRLLKNSLFLLALGMAFVSCNDDISGQDGPDGYVPGEYLYLYAPLLHYRDKSQAVLPT